jgi:hypothetical protein
VRSSGRPKFDPKRIVIEESATPNSRASMPPSQSESNKATRC